MTFEFWFLLPVAFAIATPAMASGIGGLFVALVSTGLGELNDYFLLKRCEVPSRVSWPCPGIPYPREPDIT
jgi:hypothetical protein